jgi:hypothetical protein
MNAPDFDEKCKEYVYSRLNDPNISEEERNDFLFYRKLIEGANPSWIRSFYTQDKG